MGTLEVHGDGLNALSAQCTAIASRFVSQVPNPTRGPSTQATVPAVEGTYAALDTTATLLADRVHTTGRKLTASVDRYLDTDETSAQQLSALGHEPRQR
ncbi:hypothetical protein B1R94_00275 [Mycolicibacterium litorale]|nr:hypothetical protein B1R94_00275 [Mycolicibacterium litorale]